MSYFQGNIEMVSGITLGNAVGRVFSGAVTGITVGAVVDILWLTYMSGTGVYEIIPGFFAGLLAAVIISLISPAPSQEVENLFDKAIAMMKE